DHRRHAVTCAAVSPVAQYRDRVSQRAGGRLSQQRGDLATQGRGVVIGHRGALTFEQAGQANPQRASQVLQLGDGNVAFGALQLGDEAGTEARPHSELLAAQALGAAQVADGSAQGMKQVGPARRMSCGTRSLGHRDRPFSRVTYVSNWVAWRFAISLVQYIA